MDQTTDTSDRLPARSRKRARIGDAWLEASIECSTTEMDLFDLALSLRAADGPLTAPPIRERYARVSLHPSSPRYAPRVLAGSEIARLVGLLGDDAPPAVTPSPRRRRTVPLRPLAGALALLALLFPGFALVPAVAHADDGGLGDTVTTATTPTDTTSTTTTPTGTTTTPTDTTTTPTDTTTTPTDTTTTPTDPTTTEPTPTEPATTTPTIPDYHNYAPAPSGPAKTITIPVKKAAEPAVKKATPEPAKPKATPKPKPKPETETATPSTTSIDVPAGLLDPTPPALRLDSAFAQNLTTVAAGAHVDWALLLAVIRAEGRLSSTPVTEPSLESLALNLAQRNPASSPHAAARGILNGSRDLATRAVALTNYYHAVGLAALVNGLNWAKPALEKKILADPRVSIYAGGRQDITRDKVDVRVLAVIEYLAQTYGQVSVSCLISGHRLYARPGVVSAHIYGRAVDISVVRDTPIADHQQPGGITESAIKSILLLPPEMMPNQVISLLSLGGPSFALADHWNHIHIGYAPALALLPGTSRVQVPQGEVSLLHLWQAAGAAYGVPWQVLAAINKVETNFGQNQGPSSAGAVGWMQFLPSTWARWGLDANGDGVANPSDPADAIFSAARYLSAAGAGANLPRAIFAYNHAQWYVSEVLQLATLFGGANASMFDYLPGMSLLDDEEGVATLQDQALELDQPFSLSERWQLTRSESPEMQDRPYSLSSQWAVRHSLRVAAAHEPQPRTSWISSVPRLIAAPFANWLLRERTILRAPVVAPAETFSLGVRQAAAAGSAGRAANDAAPRALASATGSR